MVELLLLKCSRRVNLWILGLTEDAFQIEQKVLIWLRKTKGLEVYLSEFEMPQGGYTETVDASEIDLPTIWAKVEELSRVKSKE